MKVLEVFAFQQNETQPSKQIHEINILILPAGTSNPINWGKNRKKGIRKKAWKRWKANKVATGNVLAEAAADTTPKLKLAADSKSSHVWNPGGRRGAARTMLFVCISCGPSPVYLSLIAVKYKGRVSRWHSDTDSIYLIPSILVRVRARRCLNSPCVCVVSCQRVWPATTDSYHYRFLCLRHL